jgi:hypothetical protein
MDWAGFEPATLRLRSVHYYQPELPALSYYRSILHLLLFPDIKYQVDVLFACKRITFLILFVLLRVICIQYQYIDYLKL